MKKIVILFLFQFVLRSSVFAQTVDTPAPDFTHQTLSHGSVSLSDYQGKVVYLFFFGWG